LIDRYVLLKRCKDDPIKLKVWTDMFPLLGQAYELKRKFFDIYEAKPIHDADELYQNWLSNIPKEKI